jgi:hypothetical protein
MNTLQETLSETDKRKHEEAIDMLLGTGKKESATQHAKAVAHITFEHAPHQCVTIMTHCILEISTNLPPKQPHSITLLHTAGTIQIIGEALETLATLLRNMQVSYLATGKHESRGVVSSIVVNGGGMKIY